MIRLSIPGILGMSVNALNVFVDALFVGQYEGEAGVAGISLALPLTMITNGFAAMIGVGASSVLSRAIGSKDVLSQRKIFGITLTLSLIISICLAILGYTFAAELIALMGGSGEMLVLGTAYYEILIVGSFAQIFAVSSNMLIRAEGKIKEAMIYNIIATLLNIALNYIFLAYFGWGIEGTAIATIIAMCVFSALNLQYFWRGKASFEVDISYLGLDKKILPGIMSVGVSAMMLQIMFFLQQAVIFNSLAYYGTGKDIAFMGAIYRILMLVIMPIFGFVQSMQPIVGINYGAKDYKRVRSSLRIFGLSGTTVLLLLTIPLLIFPEAVLHVLLPDTIFTSNDILHFRWSIVTLPLLPVFFMVNTFFQSIGNGKVSAILTVGRQLALGVPFILILPLLYGVSGIYYSAAWVDIFAVLAAVLYARNAFAKMRKLEI